MTNHKDGRNLEADRGHLEVTGAERNIGGQLRREIE